MNYIANQLTGFYISATLTLNGLKFKNSRYLSKNVNHPILNRLIKYRTDPSILAIKSKNGMQRLILAGCQLKR